MRTKEELDRLREQAIALRRAGKSRREIQTILGLTGHSMLNQFLQGVPPPDWTRRPNAKDDLRDQARELRAEGLNYKEIAARLGVSKSSVSLWVRDLPIPPRLSYEENRRRSAEGTRQYWEQEREVRSARRADTRAAAGAEIGELTARELLIAGVVAYWCEGAKSKSYRRLYRVIFTNSDPGLIRLFLRFLDSAGIPQTDLAFTVCIHESADVEAAEQFWLAVTGAESRQFSQPTLKRHRPKTTRKNVGEGYHGCLRIGIRSSSELLRKIEGWAEAIMTSEVKEDGRVSNHAC
jgi:DNA-binding CsgD family transcriptional regulator